MKKYRCNLCKFEISEDDYKDMAYVCPKCGTSRFSFSEVVDLDEPIKYVYVSENNLSIRRTIETCINCGMCKKTCNSKLGLNKDGDVHLCVGCGRCVMTCPTGSLTPKYDYMSVLESIRDESKCVVCFYAPAVRTSLGECFGFDFGENVEGKMVSAFRALGFDYVLDTTFGADMTIMEEAREAIDRKLKGGVMPMFTSCCPAWVKYVHSKRPEFIPNLSTTKSPNAIMGVLVKSYFAREKGLDSKSIVTVGIVPCTSKKMEARREELVNDGL